MMDFDFDAAIFDMDGTLLNTMPYWRFTTLEYMLAHQWPIEDEVLLKMFHTSGRRMLMELAQRDGRNIDRMTMIHELEGYMNRHYLNDAKLKSPSVPAFLETLKSHGVRMCVATGSPREYARNGLGRLGLLSYFDFITDNYQGAYTKDQPDYFEALLGRLGASRERTWVFEDALYAMQSAKASGLRVCAIADDTQAAEWPQIQQLADICIKDYNELMK